MSIKLTLPQATLLGELAASGKQGVFKATAYTPAEHLVSMGFAKWAKRFNNGRTGCLVITEKGAAFRRGEL